MCMDMFLQASVLSVLKFDMWLVNLAVNYYERVSVLSVSKLDLLAKHELICFCVLLTFFYVHGLCFTAVMCLFIMWSKAYFWHAPTHCH